MEVILKYTLFMVFHIHTEPCIFVHINKNH